MESQELSDIPSFSQTLSEAEIKKIEESLRLDVDNEGYGPKDNDSLVSYLDSFRNVGISSSSTSGEDRSFDALFRLQQQDQDQYQGQQLARSNYSHDENEKSTVFVSASQHSIQPEQQQQQQQQYYQPPLSNNRPQLHENLHSLLPPPQQQPSSFQVFPNQVPNLQHHNMYNNMVSSQLGNSFPQPKFGYSMDLYTNNTVGGGNNHNTINISSQYNHTANYNGVDSTNQNNGIIIPEAEAVSTEQSSSSPMENGDYDWLATNQLDTPYSHPYIRSLPSDAAGVGGMTVVNNHTNNNNPKITNSNMMMTTMPSAYTVGGGVSSPLQSYTPDCNNNVNNNAIITTATTSPDYYEPMKNNGNNHHGNNHHNNSGGRSNSDVGVVGTNNGGSQSNYNNHFDFPFHSQQQQMNNAVFNNNNNNNNNNTSLLSNTNMNGTNGMRLNDYQIHLHSMMIQQQQQQQQQQQFVSQQMSHSFPPMTMSNNFNHLHHQQKQYQQQFPQPYHQPLQNSFRYGSNDNTSAVPMRMSSHNHHQQHHLATPSVAAESLTSLSGSNSNNNNGITMMMTTGVGGYSFDIGSGMTATSITGSNGMVVKRCRSVLDGTDNEDVEDESCRLGSSRSNSSVSESYDEHDDEDNNRYHHTAAAANYIVNGNYNGNVGGVIVGNGMNGNINYNFNNNSITTNNNINNNRSVNSSPTKMTSKHKLMRVSGSYSATTSPSVVQRRQILQQQQGMAGAVGGVGHQQQDKAPSKIRYEWKTHFAALLHFCNAHGHCKVPRTLEYTCEVPCNNSSSIIGGGINTGSSMNPSFVAAFSTSSPSVTVNNGYIISNYNNNASSSTYGYNSNSNVIIDNATNNGSNNASNNNNLSNKSSATDTSASTLGSTTTVDTGAAISQPQQQTIIYTGKLGRWLDDQRKARKGKRTKLTPEREAMLQRLVDEGKLLWDATELKPNEINKKRGDLNWPRAYAALLKFGEIHGHYNVPKRGNFKCELPDMPDENGSTIYDAKLGNWLYWQRELKKGRRCGLASERESQLQSLADQGKLTWDVSDMNASQRSQQRGDTSWPRAYQALLVYGQEEGDYNVPDKKVYQCLLPNGDVYSANLGNWLNGQRKLKKSNAAAAASSSSSNSSTNKGNNNSGSNSQAQLPPEREKLLQNLADQGKFNW